MNHITVNNGVVNIICNSISTIHSEVDKRCKRLSKICKHYPPLDSFSDVDDSIFHTEKFKN